MATVFNLLAMTDGHTKEGSQIVKLDKFEITWDEVQQLIRSMEWAKMMDSHDDKTKQQPEPMRVTAHRAFLQGILGKLYQAVLEQFPELDPHGPLTDLPQKEDETTKKSLEN